MDQTKIRTPGRWALVAAASPLIIFLGLALFAYPTLDDWDFRSQAIHHGVVGGTLSHLLHWGGRFAVIPLNLCLHSLPLPELVFPAVIALNLVLLAVSLRSLLPAALPRPWLCAAALAAVVACTLPSPVQGLYWMCAMLAYVFPLHLFALALRVSDRPRTSGRDAALVVAGIVCAGFGETAAILFAGSAAILALDGHRPARWLVVGAAVGMAVTTCMPGTWARLAAAHGHAPFAILHIVVSAGSEAWRLAADQCSRGAMLAALLLAIHLGASRERPAVLSRPWLALLALPLVAAAFLPSIAALGLIEGRQRDAAWLTLLLWLLAAGWSFGAARPRWFAGAGPRYGMRVGLGLLLCATASEMPFLVESPATLAVGVAAVLVVGWAVLAGLRDDRPSALAAALAALLWIAPMALRATGDLLLRAPYRRAELAARDREVARLAALGARHVRFPLANPGTFPATLSLGEPGGSRDWVAMAYASCTGLDSAGSDPRLDRVVATDAAGRILSPQPGEAGPGPAAVAP